MENCNAERYDHWKLYFCSASGTNMVKVCCQVILNYLKGNSRKNRNYLSTVASLFKRGSTFAGVSVRHTFAYSLEKFYTFNLLGIRMRIFASRQCADYARALHMRVQVRRTWHVLRLL